MTDRIEDDDLYRRRDSLRLRRFDYSAHRVYFVTIVVADRRQVFREQRLAEAILGRLLELRDRLGFKLYCYCLMPDHFHALIGTGDSGRSLGEICGAVKSLTTREYWRWHQGKLWQRQFYDHVVRNEIDFFETLEYIRMNPVRKGLVRTPDEWPYTGKVDIL